MVVEALSRVKTVSGKGEEKYPLKAVNVLKAHGKSSKDSMFIEGYALNCTIASQGILFTYQVDAISNAEKSNWSKTRPLGFQLEQTKNTDGSQHCNY